MQSEPNQTCSANGLRVAIIVSRYHSTITEKLASAATSTFIDAGGLEEDCKLVHVAGAWELPVLAKTFSKENNVDAIVALGCIIAGETTHGRVIGDAIAQGLMTIALEWGQPVSMGVLTCQSMEQAEARSGGSAGNKGIEAMNAAIETAVSLKEQRS